MNNANSNFFIHLGGRGVNSKRFVALDLLEHVKQSA